MGGEIDLAIEGLSDYQLIGSGGFAMVYSAFEHGLNRQVAVKVLAAVDGPGRRRFDRERMSMGRTADHPNIVTPLRSGYTDLPDSRPYLVMEYLPGGSLQDRLNTRGPMPWADAVEILVPIADALAYSHELGVIHKDIKPGNILLARTGTAKLTDFGIASVLGATATTQVAFSLAYAAPETFGYDPNPAPGQSPDRRDHRSDIYSLAATLHALGTGLPPYQSESWGGLMSQIVSAPVPRVGIEPLDRFFARAMAKDPADRPQTTGELVEHLRALLGVLAGDDDRNKPPSEAPTELAADGPAFDDRPSPGPTATGPAPAPVLSPPRTPPPPPRVRVVPPPVAPPAPQPQPIAQPATPSVFDTGVAAESEFRRRGGNRRWQPLGDEDTGGGPERCGPATAAPSDPVPEPRPDLRLALLAVAVLVVVVALVAAIRLLAG